MAATLGLCLGQACGDDTKSPADDNDAGQQRQDAGTGRDSGSDDTEGDGWSVPCNATGRSEVLLDDLDALDISVSGEHIVFPDWSLGEAYVLHLRTGGIRSVKTDGTGPRVLYVAPKDHRVTHAFVDGEYVYFPMVGPVDGRVSEEATYLWRMPLAGGEPTLFCKPEGSFAEESEIFASDENSLYVVSGRQLVRVAKSDGTPTVIVDKQSAHRPQLFEGKIWYTLGQSDESVRNVPADATGASPTIFSKDACAWYKSLSVTPSGVFCGLAKYSAEGERDYIDDQLEEYTPGGVSHPVGDEVILYGDERMDELDVNTLAQRTLTCDATSAVDIHVTADAIYWLENVNSDAKHKLFRLKR